jgi:hypothetical protein
MKKKDKNEITGGEAVESVSSAYKNSGKKKELTPEQKIERERRELGPNNFSRKVRRNQLQRAGILKMKNKLAFCSNDWSAWYEKTMTEGKRLFEENAEAVRKQQEWYLERIDENKRKHLDEFYTNAGLSKKEVKEKIEIEMAKWYETILGNQEKIEKRKEEKN